MPLLYRLIRICGAALLLTLSGCGLFTRPTPEPIVIEEAQGRYEYKDSTDTYSGRFVLLAHEDMLAIDLFAFYLSVASIRHSKDSTLLYLPIQNEVLILGPDACLPLEGWEIPIAPLARAYKGAMPDEPDSTKKLGDTLVVWAGDIAYLQAADISGLTALRSKDWELLREGEIEGIPDRTQKIVFKQKDATLLLEFTDFKLIEKESPKAFVLNLPAGVERIDYR